MILNLHEAYALDDPRTLLDHTTCQLDIGGVESVQWLHALTVRFVDEEALKAGRRLTGWERFGSEELTLEARLSYGAGYDHAAVVVGGLAYCGLSLVQ